MDERNAKVLGPAASSAQLSELALFECEARVQHTRPILEYCYPSPPRLLTEGSRRDLRDHRARRTNRIDFAPTGGYTNVTLTGPDNINLGGVAVCSERDNFCRREGTEIALKRAMRKLPGGESGAAEFNSAGAGLTAALKVVEGFPHTPREGLLMVLWLAEAWDVTDDQFRDLVKTISVEGLRPGGPATFELTDRLAGGLAEAHEQIILGNGEPPPLPPDLEAMVDLRRSRHGG